MTHLGDQRLYEATARRGADEATEREATDREPSRDELNATRLRPCRPEARLYE